MRVSVIFFMLILALMSHAVDAECFSQDGEKINAGFLECTKNGHRYLGEIEPSAVRFLLGTWSTDCAAMKSKIVYQWRDKKFIVQIYDANPKENILTSQIFLEVLGIKVSGGLLYLAGKSHTTLALSSTVSSSESSVYVLVAYKEIDKNTRSVEEGYIIRDGTVEQDIKDGVFVKSGEKMVYSRCHEDGHR